MHDPKHHMSLLDAFSMTGQAIYQSEWTGYEYIAPPVSGFNQRKIELALAQKKHSELKHAAKLLYELGYASGYAAEAYEQFAQDGSNILDDIREVSVKISRLKDTLALKVRDDATFRRRQRAEARLGLAFSRKELNLLCGGSSIVPFNEWIKEARFKLSFTYSLIYSPEDRFKPRRQPAFVDREAFMEWFTSQLVAESKVSKDEGPEVFFAMYDWFVELLRKSGKVGPMPEIKRAFDQQFTSHAKGSFKTLWKALVPENRIYSGRPREVEE